MDRHLVWAFRLRILPPPPIEGHVGSARLPIVPPPVPAWRPMVPRLPVVSLRVVSLPGAAGRYPGAVSARAAWSARISAGEL